MHVGVCLCECLYMWVGDERTEKIWNIGQGQDEEGTVSATLENCGICTAGKHRIKLLRLTSF